MGFVPNVTDGKALTVIIPAVTKAISQATGETVAEAATRPGSTKQSSEKQPAKSTKKVDASKTTDAKRSKAKQTTQTNGNTKQTASPQASRQTAKRGDDHHQLFIIGGLIIVAAAAFAWFRAAFRRRN